MTPVYRMDLKAGYGNSLEAKFRRLLGTLDLDQLIGRNELVAIKVHVGERENLGYLNHNYARIVAEEVFKRGGKPFLTDTNTLYSGGRKNAVDHCITANQHGYCLPVCGAPFVAGDGLRGLDFVEVPVNGKHIGKAKLARTILEADKIIFLSHFKGHVEAGFGGTLKNMAMGCAAIPGKMEQHSSAQPSVNEAKCVGCGQCVKVCPEKAISLENRKARIRYESCVGCGQCVAACGFSAMAPKWNEHHDAFLEKMAEYALGVYRHFQGKAGYLNFALNIAPDCDCWPANDVPVVEDVGILASREPLALDAATLALVNRARPNPNSEHAHKIKNQGNIFQEIRPEVDSAYLLKYLESFGLDSGYELKSIS